MSVGLLAIALALSSSGCANAIFSMTSSRSHDAYSEERYEQFIYRRDRAEPMGKAEVLATLGPPVHVIVQDEGEVFVYRRVARDISILNLNPSMLPILGPMPPIPVYYRRQESGRDDTLMIFFDAAGRVRDQSARSSVDDVEQSGAAWIGEGMQKVLP